jgi:type I restriction enzyme S subunit
MPQSIPPGWVKTTLGDVVHPSRPRVSPSETPELPFIGMEHIEAHTMRLLGTVPAGEMRSNAVHFQPNDVLYGRLRPYLNKVYRPDFEGLCSAEFIVFPFSEHLESRLVQYFLNSSDFVAFATHLNEGDRPRVDFNQLADYPFLLPPLAEQRRIVAELERHFTRLDVASTSLRQASAKLERYRKSILSAACEGRLVPIEAELARQQRRDFETASQLLARILANRRARWEQEQLQKMRERGDEPKNNKWKRNYQEPRPPDISDLPEIPAGWGWASIEQLASGEPRSIQSGPFGSNLLHSEFQTTGILAIGIDNVLDGKFSLGSQNRISLAKYVELERYSARPLDVLVTVMATVGRCCVLPEDVEKAIITKHVYRISVNRDLVNPFYLMNALRGCTAVREQLKVGIRGQTRPGINSTIVRMLAIPLPPIREQRRIVDEVDVRLSLAESMSGVVENELRRSARLRQSVLTRALEGRLVAQDPTDESASVLLDRIRADRPQPVAGGADQTKSKRKRGKHMAQTRSGAKKTVRQVLEEARAPLTPEQLFAATGHVADTIDEFYAELKAYITAGQIEEVRSGKDGVLLRTRHP